MSPELLEHHLLSATVVQSPAIAFPAQNMPPDVFSSDSETNMDSDQLCTMTDLDRLVTELDQVDAILAALR